MNLSERKRQLVRDELRDAAMRCLAFQGFEETTIDQIVAAAGVSRRTFFRYFESKEDVIVEFLAELGGHVRDSLAARPADEPPATALRGAFQVFIEACDHAPEKSLRLTKIILGSPALMARYQDRLNQWRFDLTGLMGERMAVDPAVDLRPGLLTSVAFAAFDTAWTSWARTEGARKLTVCVDEAFERAVFPIRV